MKHWSVVSLLLLFAGCSNSTNEEGAPMATLTSAGNESAEPIPSATYEEAHTAAVAAIEIAAGKRNAWSTSDSLLKQAQAAATDGDEPRAIRLADEARIHAELAAKQADAESLAWRARALTN